MYSVSVRLLKLTKAMNKWKYHREKEREPTYTHKDIQHLQLPDNHQTLMAQNFSCCVAIPKYTARIGRNVHRP